jgi:hypothetical protein
MGGVGVGFCLCADVGTVLEAGCIDDCQSTGHVVDADPHAGAKTLSAMSGIPDGGGVYLPFDSGEFFHASSLEVKLHPLKTSFFQTAPWIDELNSVSGGDTASILSHAPPEPRSLSAFLLAQKTVVLRI